ncbi:hypothetical protein RV134_350277 [Roseovarius sp. EC-HK134]|nr:hypothetical protein RV134_350277 [Roseovarius sp. EC-HK134]
MFSATGSNGLQHRTGSQALSGFADVINMSWLFAIYCEKMLTHWMQPARFWVVYGVQYPQSRRMAYSRAQQHSSADRPS